MCGRFTLHSPAEALRHRFRIELPAGEAELAPRFNICPSEDVWTVAIDRERGRRALPMRWGFIPFLSKEPGTRLSTINAKVETAATSAMYRDAFQRRRCLILADGFYEWQPAPGGGRRAAKRPHWIHRGDG